MPANIMPHLGGVKCRIIAPECREKRPLTRPSLREQGEGTERSEAGEGHGTTGGQLTFTSFCRLRRPDGKGSPLARTRRPQLVKETSPT
jgi:hypothetical protein